MWRVLCAPSFTVSLEEIETHWSLLDVLDANEALDAVDDVQEWRRQQRKSEEPPIKW